MQCHRGQLYYCFDLHHDAGHSAGITNQKKEAMATLCHSGKNKTAFITQNNNPEETRKNHKGRADVVAKENFDPSSNVQRRAPR